MFERYTDRARRVIVLAQEEARMLKHDDIGTGHILLGLIHEGEGGVAAESLENLGICLDAVREQVQEIIGQGQQASSGHLPFTPRATEVLELTQREALEFGHSYIGTGHILLGLIREGEGVAAQMLVKLGADLNRVREQVIQLLTDDQRDESAGSELTSTQSKWPEDAQTEIERVERVREIIRARPLDQFGRNLTRAAHAGKLEPAIGRGKEIERVMQVLCRKDHNNVLLVGEPGIGTGLIVAGLAALIVKEEVPKRLRNQWILEVSHSSYDGWCLENGVEGDLVPAMIRDLRGLDDVILFVNGLRSLTPAALSDIEHGLASLSALRRGTDQQIICVLTPAESDHLNQRAPALAEAFQPMRVAELSVAHVVEYLKVHRDQYQAYHRVSITDAALVSAAFLAGRYIDHSALPQKAIDLIDDACARLNVQRQMTSSALRELDERIAHVRHQTASAIDDRDVEKVAFLRDDEKMLWGRRVELEKQWESDVDGVAEVDEERIADVVADLLGEPELARLTGDSSGATGGARLQAHLQASLTTGHATAYEELLTDQLRVLGADHADTLATRSSLADARWRAGDLAGAATAHEDLLTAQLRVLGADHADTLTTRDNLAFWRGRAGDLAGSAIAYEELLAAQLRVLGAYHADILTTRDNLAYCRGEAGDPTGAAAAYGELLADQLRVLGPDHPDILTTRDNLACCRGEAGDLTGAIRAYGELLADQLRVLGPDHPDTLTTRSHLALRRGEAGDPAGAATAFAELLIDQLRVLGADHGDTLATRGNVATWRGKAGDAAGAATAFLELLTGCLRALGPDHCDTLAARGGLARWQGRAGDAPGAAIAIAELLTDCLRVLGHDHPHTLKTRENLAEWQGKAGDPAGVQ